MVEKENIPLTTFWSQIVILRDYTPNQTNKFGRYSPISWATMSPQSCGTHTRNIKNGSKVDYTALVKSSYIGEHLTRE